MAAHDSARRSARRSAHPTAHRSGQRRLSGWLSKTVEAVSFLLLCLFSLAAIVLIIVPLVTGSQTYSVLTSSMAPAYPPGTFLVVKPTQFEELQTGDVVTYQLESGQPDVITHRITGFSAGQDGERLLVTQGDNNDVVDPDPVREVQVRGKLFYAVPYVGFVASALGTSDRGAWLTVAALGLIVWGLFTMVRGILAARRDRHDEQLLAEAEATVDSLDSPDAPDSPDSPDSRGGERP